MCELLGDKMCGFFEKVKDAWILRLFLNSEINNCKNNLFDILHIK